MHARWVCTIGLVLALTGAAAQAQSPTAVAPDAAPPGAAGLAPEFAERLTAGASLAAADREDRAALARFYAGRGHEPVWIAADGPTPPAAAAMAEIRRAGEWGLDPSAFQLPDAAAGGALSRAQRADAEVLLGLAVLNTPATRAAAVPSL
jgi:hypothetical protein